MHNLGWLANSLEHRAKEFRSNERACRRAYRGEYMKSVADRLAECHARAAEIYERELALVLAEMPAARANGDSP